MMMIFEWLSVDPRVPPEYAPRAPTNVTVSHYWVAERDGSEKLFVAIAYPQHVGNRVVGVRLVAFVGLRFACAKIYSESEWGQQKNHPALHSGPESAARI